MRFKLTTLFKTLVDLQMMVQGIEEDLGLSDLGNIEKRVLLSIIEFLRSERCGIHSRDIGPSVAHYLLKAVIVQGLKAS
jgi:hypothetical protein